MAIRINFENVNVLFGLNVAIIPKDIDIRPLNEELSSKRQ